MNEFTLNKFRAVEMSLQSPGNSSRRLAMS